jgi:hypothetical protein
MNSIDVNDSAGVLDGARVLITNRKNVGKSTLISCVYTPFIRKINFKMSKNLEKNMHMYSIFYVVT